MRVHHEGETIVTAQPELLPCPKDVETLRNANNAVALLQEIIEGLRSHPNPPTHRGVPLDGSLWFVKMCVTDLQMLQSRTSPATHTQGEDWQHWTHRKGSKAKELTYEEVEENE